MSKERPHRHWYIGFGIAATVVTVVAALVLALIATARSILQNAERALAVAREIVEHTRPIWELDSTNTAAAQLLQQAQSIERHATEVADALEAPEPVGR